MEILYQDNRIVVCVKPAGVLSTDEPGGMPELLRAALGTDCIRTVHRLDAAVGGVMVFARSRMAASILSEQVREHRLRKEYLAVAEGRLPEGGKLRDFLLRDTRTGVTCAVPEGTPGAKEARLTYRALSCTDDATLVRIVLGTGRTHQIRVQFASRGHPLRGDRKYGSGSEGLALWSCRLGLFHPQTGQWMEFARYPDKIPAFSAFSACLFEASGV